MYHSVVRMLVSTLFTALVAGVALLAPMTGDEVLFLSLFAFFWFFMVEVFFAVFDFLGNQNDTRIFECLLTACQLMCVTVFAVVVQILV